MKLKNTVKTYLETFYFTRLEKCLKEIKFLDIYNLPKLNYDWVNNLNRPITSRIEVNNQEKQKEAESPRPDRWSLQNCITHQ